MGYISIATEDALSEAVVEKLISIYTNFHVEFRLRRGGNGYLKSKLDAIYNIATYDMPVVLLTDLDNIKCAPKLIRSWSAKIKMPRPDRLLFRVAVREIEAWLLSDHENIGPYLRAKKLTGDVDSIIDPKSELLRLARKAPREVRDDLIPVPGAAASVGLGYNARLVDFVERHWNPENGRSRSDSLDRMCRRLIELDDSEI